MYILLVYNHNRSPGTIKSEPAQPVSIAWRAGTEVLLVVFLVLIGLFVVLCALVVWIQDVTQRYLELKVGSHGPMPSSHHPRVDEHLSTYCIFGYFWDVHQQILTHRRCNIVRSGVINESWKMLPLSAVSQQRCAVKTYTRQDCFHSLGCTVTRLNRYE